MENQNNQQEQLVQKKQNQKKNALFGIVALLIVAVIGGTIAYFSSTASFVNKFETATYKTVTTEVFESPDNWTPGETVPKTVTTTNEGSIPVAVRTSYTETWEDLEGNPIQSPANAVTINFDNTSEWINEGNYYYYKYKLEPNDTTSSFISGVTLNNGVGTVTCTPSQDGLTHTCEATNPALGKVYKLTITTETIQFDSYEDVWNTNVVTNCSAPVSFATDSWDKIVCNVKNDVSSYPIGAIKEISLTGFGNHTIRVVNNTYPTECENDNFSRTSCGFVIEFTDILSNQVMSTTGAYGAPGWNENYIRTYINTTVYNSLPNDLKNEIIDTKVYSGARYRSSSPVITTDKLYLVSATEILSTFIWDLSTSYNKQLDYYEEVLSSTSFYTSKPELVKKLNGVAKSWCTRTTDGNSDGPYENSYICFTETGAGTSIGVNGEVGVSPAFRIGNN